MAEEMQQGSDYVEEEVDNDVEPKAKMDVKTVAIIGVVIMVIVIGGLLYLKSQGKIGGTNSDSATTDESGDAPEWFDETGEDTSDTEEWDEEAVAETEDGDEWVSEDDGDWEDEVTEETPDIASLSDEQTLELRSLGYTGDEIEYYMSAGIDRDAMIEAAKDSQAKKQEEIIEEVNSKSTGLYKKLLNMTWMGGKKMTVQKAGEDESISYTSFIENVDYTKCEERGKQLFIRCKLDSGEYVFMTVEPQRWKEMKKTGNIVIQYNVVSYKDTAVITDISEVQQGFDNDDSDWE